MHITCDEKVGNAVKKFIIYMALGLSLALSAMSVASCSDNPSTSTSSLPTVKDREAANSKIDLSKLPISIRQTSAVIDKEDRGQFVALSDYVVVGHVESYDGVTYRDVREVESADGNKVVADPFSRYTIKVRENLKGDLVQGKPIPIQKSGGVAYDGLAVEAEEGDAFPEVGKTYVFLIFAQPDGETLLVSGPNSNVAIDAATTSRLAALPGDAPASRYASVLADSAVRNAYAREAERDAKGEIALPDVAKRSKQHSLPVNRYDAATGR